MTHAREDAERENVNACIWINWAIISIIIVLVGMFKTKAIFIQRSRIWWLFPFGLWREKEQKTTVDSMKWAQIDLKAFWWSNNDQSSVCKQNFFSITKSPSYTAWNWWKKINRNAMVTSTALKKRELVQMSNSVTGTPFIEPSWRSLLSCKPHNKQQKQFIGCLATVSMSLLFHSTKKKTE